MKFFWYDHDYIEQRLIDAHDVWVMMPDREYAWLKSGTRSSMPARLKVQGQEYYDNFLDGAGVDNSRFTGTINDLTQKRIDLAYDTMGWTNFAGRDRELVGIVITMKAKGIDPPRWEQIRQRHMPGVRSRQTVKNRYKRGLNKIADELNKKFILTFWTA